MKKCENGHYYTDSLDHCPYCSDDDFDDGFDQNDDKTFDFNGDFGSNLGNQETIPSFDEGELNGTQEFGDVKKTVPFDNDFGSNDFGTDNSATVPPPNDDGGTIIIEAESKNNDDDEVKTRANRKLVGWLVSYTIDEMGIDFKLYEGKNSIGSSSDNDITVFQDKSISGKHATILFRNGKFKLKDEFSTNGTYLNDEIVEDETPVLKDNDIIKVGNTIFKIKIAV